MRKSAIVVFMLFFLSCAGNPHKSALRIYIQEQNPEKALQEGKKW